MEKVPFYASGLKFSCQRCSVCCRHDSGFVFLSEEDLEKLAICLNMGKSSFIKTYCRWGTNWQYTEALSLKEKNNKDCIFWDSGCIVYDSRPLQCRTFPFWSSIVSSMQSWEIASGSCPGMNTGKVHEKEEIEGFLKSQALEPVIFGNFAL